MTRPHSLRLVALLACATLASAAGAALIARGSPAPEWQATTIAGKELRSDQFAGKVLLVTVYRSGCYGCGKELPVLQSLLRKHESRGFRVVALSVDPTPELAMKLPRKVGATFPVVLDPRFDVGSRFAGSGRFQLPMSFLVGRDGKIVHSSQGLHLKELQSAVTRALATPAPQPLRPD